MAVVGPSGCGKSTLLELIAGLQEPDEGTVRAAGGARTCPSATCCSRGATPSPTRRSRSSARACRRSEARRRAEPLFERFGLAEFEDARPAELSGGMRQRVAFLRTLLPGRQVLLLDEPFGALDSITRASMQRWLADALSQEPRTVVLVTHDVDEAVFLADRVVVLSPRPGRVVAEIEVDLAGPRDVTSAGVRRRQAARTGGARHMRRYLGRRRWLLVLFVLAWQGVASLHSVDDLTLASPIETFDALRDDWSLLIDNAATTLVEVVLGLATRHGAAA